MEFNTSTELDKLAPALSQLQGKLPHVSKDSKGYGYNYADLASTLDVLKPLLVEFGFSISQFGSGDKLVTLLLHSSGQFIRGEMDLIDIEMKGTNAAQNRGAVLSYFRRYGVQAIIGMASEDSDASSKDTSRNESKKFETEAATPSRGSFRKNQAVKTTSLETSIPSGDL